MVTEKLENELYMNHRSVLMHFQFLTRRHVMIFNFKQVKPFEACSWESVELYLYNNKWKVAFNIDSWPDPSKMSSNEKL